MTEPLRPQPKPVKSTSRPQSGSSGKSGAVTRNVGTSNAGNSDSSATAGPPASTTLPTPRWLLAAVATAAVALGAYLLLPGAGTWNGAENQAPQYQHHLPLAALSTIPPVLVSDDDIDHETTQVAVAAAKSGTTAKGLTPMSPQMNQELIQGDIDFYSMHFYDTCAEDGDIVSVSLDNGTTYGPIPITHRGTTISIPVNKSKPPRITLHALKDGDGGVTVGVKTSDGVWYSAVLPEGATQPIPMKFN